MFDGLGRKKKRFQVQLPVRVSLRSVLQPFGRLTNRSDRTENSFTQNISANGCYIRLSKEMPVGSVVELEIALPSIDSVSTGGRIHCHAVVVRLQPEPVAGKIGVGCRIQHFRFENTSPRSDTARTLVGNLSRALRAVVPAPPEFVKLGPAPIPQHAG